MSSDQKKTSCPTAAELKRLVDKTMGVGMNDPDPKTGKVLLKMMKQADADNDTRVFEALARPGAGDVLFWVIDQGDVALVRRLLDAGVSPKLKALCLRPIHSAAQKPFH